MLALYLLTHAAKLAPGCAQTGSSIHVGVHAPRAFSGLLGAASLALCLLGLLLRNEFSFLRAASPHLGFLAQLASFNPLVLDPPVAGTPPREDDEADEEDRRDGDDDPDPHVHDSPFGLVTLGVPALAGS
jgi:hypothetical protein